MECTGKSITDICLDAGVESQRTFNRVSRERYKVTPREYRNLYREQYISQTQDEISGMEKYDGIYNLYSSTHNYDVCIYQNVVKLQQ